MKFYAVIGLLALLALHALAENSEVSSQSSGASPKTQTVANTKSPSESGTNWPLIPNSYGTALAAGGVAVVGVVVLLAIAAIVSPLFGYKLCQIFSTCEGSSSSLAYSLDANSGGFPASYGNNVYKKRSVEYVKPILQVLSSAYEKYGQGSLNPAMNIDNGFTTSNGNNMHKKRSVEYVKPILQVLGSAYEKYGQSLLNPAFNMDGDFPASDGNHEYKKRSIEYVAPLNPVLNMDGLKKIEE